MSATESSTNTLYQQRYPSPPQISGADSHIPSTQHSALTTTQGPGTYLSPNQQDLLLAALNSQAVVTHPPNSGQPQKPSASAPIPSYVQPANMSASTVLQSPEEVDLDNYDDYTPDLDYLDGENGYDFENADLGGDMIGALPGGDKTNGDHSEKRKSRDESAAPEGGDAKRQETEEGEKTAKKPGRKPLTTEPTTKRKAQNRAAQRAFRERKEAHLKDLETKVTELTKAQEADNHEKGLLKAQVDRLQIELREYRKRLSLNGRGNGSPPLTANNGQQRSNSGGGGAFSSNFSFDFPKFGALPGSQIFGNESLNNSTNTGILHRSSATPPQQQSRSNSIGGNAVNQSNGQVHGALSRSGSASSNTMSPTNNNMFSSPATTDSLANLNGLMNPPYTAYSTTNNMHGFASTLPQMNGSTNDGSFDGLFSPSILKSVAPNPETNYFATQPPLNNSLTSTEHTDQYGGNSTAGFNRAFQFNGGSSISDSASPASSMSQWNNNAANSSCGTSPEPSHGSPMNKEKGVESSLNNQQAQAQSTKTPTNMNNNNTNTFLNNADFNVPSLDTFDPVLFGDYRDSQDAIIGGGDFSGGFFNDSLDSVPFDYNSPSNLFGILQSPQPTNTSISSTGTNKTNTQVAPSKKCLEDCDKIRDGGDDDYGLPTTTEPAKTNASGNLISCNNIWNQLQANPDFQEGKFDLDTLCSELRSKAKCSESGVMVQQEHVDEALRKLGKKDETGKEYAFPHLMFEQDSWERVLQKMNNHT